MISSMTGSWGYSFAVPSNIARKLSRHYGIRKCTKGILGVEGGELNAKASRELGITRTEGFYISTVTKFRCPRSGLQKAIS
jgi:S1-C subfamily serine protease